MNEIINKPYEISLDHFLFGLADESGNNAIVGNNYQKVFKEKLANLAIQKFFSNDEINLETGFNFSRDKNEFEKNYYRRELFPLNYLTVNKYFLSIIRVSEINPDYISISRRIFDSKLVADFFVPVFVNTKEKTAYVLGYANVDTLKRKIFVHSEDTYFIEFKHFQNIDSILDELSKEKTIDQDTDENLEANFESAGITLERYKKNLEEGEIPEDFIEDIDYVSKKLFYSLLYSEELSEKYLEIQNMFFKLRDSKVSESNKTIDFKQWKQKILASAFLVNSKMEQYNLVIKYSSAGTQPKPKITLFESDYENVIRTATKLEAFIDNEERELRIGGLEKYIGCNWLLFADLSGNALEELGFNEEDKGDIFKNWNQEYFEKNKEILLKNSFKTGSYDANDKINDDYIDISLGEYFLPEDIAIYFAVFVERQ